MTDILYVGFYMTDQANLRCCKGESQTLIRTSVVINVNNGIKIPNGTAGRVEYKPHTIFGPVQEKGGNQVGAVALRASSV